MLRDVIANLQLGSSRSVATDFAISVAAAFNAHVTGLGLLYEPSVPMMVDMYSIPADVFETRRLENENAARAAVAHFNTLARDSALSAEARTINAPAGDVPNLFASIARRFDLSVIAQPAPGL